MLVSRVCDNLPPLTGSHHHLARPAHHLEPPGKEVLQHSVRLCQALQAGTDLDELARTEDGAAPGAVVGPGGEGGETAVAETAGQADPGQVPRP